MHDISAWSIMLTVAAYFAVLLIVSRLTSGRGDNDTFFRGNRQSPWYMVAFGMVGASISGVTFVSVPGMVMVSDMNYLQTCLGFVLGYFVVGFVLLLSPMLPIIGSENYGSRIWLAIGPFSFQPTKPPHFSGFEPEKMPSKRQSSK